jgi:hypothetical protein
MSHACRENGKLTPDPLAVVVTVPVAEVTRVVSVVVVAPDAPDAPEAEPDPDPDPLPPVAAWRRSVWILEIESNIHLPAQKELPKAITVLATSGPQAALEQSRIPKPKLTFLQRHAVSELEHPKDGAKLSMLLMQVCC